jgi:hypothetical protein
MNDLIFKPAPTSEPAQWIVDSLQDFGNNVGSIIPRGFEAYARVFHPAWQVTPETRTPLRWSDVTKKTGQPYHKQMLWEDVRGDEPEIYDYSTNTLSTWIEGPEEGNLPKNVARALWQILEQHTQTPDDCFFAIWEGCGCLPKSVLEAPSFEIPGRKFHLHQAPIQAIEETFCTNDTKDDTGRTVSVGILNITKKTKIPSLAEVKQLMKDFYSPTFPVFYRNANLWWSNDRSWCVATEIDFNFTYVGGSREVVQAILDCETLEALQVDITDAINNWEQK